MTQAAFFKRPKALGFIQKQGNWVPYELKPRDVERLFCMSEMLLERHKKKSFLHRIVTGDEKWIHYEAHQIVYQARPTSQIVTEEEYSRCQGNALYLVG